MDSNTSSTGISHLNKSEPSEAIIFGDDTCPKCGNKMEVEYKWLQGIQIAVRYLCKHCKFVCPVKHDENNMDKLSPTYDKSIFNFLSNFGRDIHDRIKDISKREI